MEEEDEAGCCARHGTLASGLESWAPRARRCIASFTSQPLFYPFFFHLSSPYFFLSLPLFFSLSPSFLSSALGNDAEEITVLRSDSPVD